MRRRAYNDPGHAHFLAFSCFQRCEILADDCACHLLANSIDRAHCLHQFDVWAYVFMPDHVHLLIWPRREAYDISEILRSIKSSFALRLISDWRQHCPAQLQRLRVEPANGISYRVWQRGGGFDRNLYSSRLVHRAIEYIEANPVRKGYVIDPSEWKWSSARSRFHHGSNDLLVNDLSLVGFGREHQETAP